jgi:hypothetical protein
MVAATLFLCGAGVFRRRSAKYSPKGDDKKGNDKATYVVGPGLSKFLNNPLGLRPDGNRQAPDGNGGVGQNGWQTGWQGGSPGPRRNTRSPGPRRPYTPSPNFGKKRVADMTDREIVEMYKNVKTADIPPEAIKRIEKFDVPFQKPPNLQKSMASKLASTSGNKNKGSTPSPRSHSMASPQGGARQTNTNRASSRSRSRPTNQDIDSGVDTSHPFYHPSSSVRTTNTPAFGVEASTGTTGDTAEAILERIKLREAESKRARQENKAIRERLEEELKKNPPTWKGPSS